MLECFLALINCLCLDAMFCVLSRVWILFFLDKFHIQTPNFNKEFGLESYLRFYASLAFLHAFYVFLFLNPLSRDAMFGYSMLRFMFIFRSMLACLDLTSCIFTCDLQLIRQPFWPKLVNKIKIQLQG